MAKKKMLNAGAGLTIAKRIQPLLSSHEWEEIRLDVDDNVDPDVVGSITDVARLFPPASFDAIWCSHVMEHLYAHEVHPTFVQFREVLKPDGFALVMSPDLEAVAQHMLTQGLGAIAYVSAAGPIRPLDMIYGHSGAIEQGRYHMAHKTGFSSDRMGNLLLSAGFPTVSVRSENFEICALALMPEADDRRIRPELEACGFDFQETATAVS